ncbi:MAG: hypothetical protein JST68_23665, partial [Bacteroidetes bacterium]|nr:hypothetical protein [Bacteroidota bacterium]
TNGANQDYKSMQYLYVARSIRRAKLTGLVFADEFGRYKPDSIRTIAGSDTGYLYGRRFNQPGVNARVTAGLLLNTPLDRRNYWRLQAGFYYQGGKDRDGLDLSAYTSTLSLSYNRQLYTVTIGWDYLSGNDAFSSSTTSHRFDPLYGTPHKFWGYMDYFYAGTGSPTGGLNNPFLKGRYASRNNRFTLELAYHYFGLARSQKDAKGSAVSSCLGSEIDLIANYQLNKVTTVETGFCGLAASRSMEYAKGITPGTARTTATWAYLQLNIRPDFLTK